MERVCVRSAAEKEEFWRRKDCWTEVEKLKTAFVRFEGSTRDELDCVTEELHRERREKIVLQQENRELSAKLQPAL